MKAFYFGCYRGPGHYWRTLGMQQPRYEEIEGVVPWGYYVDGKLCPGWVEGEFYAPRTRPEIEGEALIHQKDGWTALSFWDRSEDKRGGCNSNFFVDRTYSFDEMVTLAQKTFPEIWKRFGFEVRLAK